MVAYTGIDFAWSGIRSGQHRAPNITIWSSLCPKPEPYDPPCPPCQPISEKFPLFHRQDHPKLSMTGHTLVRKWVEALRGREQKKTLGLSYFVPVDGSQEDFSSESDPIRCATSRREAPQNYRMLQRIVRAPGSQSLSHSVFLLVPYYPPLYYPTPLGFPRHGKLKSPSTKQRWGHSGIIRPNEGLNGRGLQVWWEMPASP